MRKISTDACALLRAFSLAVGLSLSGAACAQPALEAGPAEGPPPGYELVWSDEFDAPGLPDPARWAYDTWRNKDGWWNGEAQYYAGARAKNARIENGILVIQAHREQLDPAQFPDWGGQDYTSARLVTRGIAEWTYGFVEVRAKLPCGRGSWPAIWMLGAAPHNQWPLGGEIDIMEHVGYAPDQVHAAIHSQAYNHVNGNQRKASLDLPDACEAFHNYQLTWTADEILIAVDGQRYFRFPNDGAGDDRTWPFHRAQYLILNVAIGGGWGGREGVDDEIFPIKMEVDYVRVYQLRGAQP